MGGAGGAGSNDRIALDGAGKSQGVFSGALIWSADRNYCGGELVLTRSTIITGCSKCLRPTMSIKARPIQPGLPQTGRPLTIQLL